MSDETSPHPEKSRPAPPQPGDPYQIPPQGSLGLLALGHRGLQQWREVRDETLDEVEAAHGPEARRKHPAAPNLPAEKDEEAESDDEDAPAARAEERDETPAEG